MISDVLFVRDRKNPELFHPRISAQLDFIYESLYDSDKVVFNRLYNDYFYRRHNQFWYGEAMKKLPKLVQATRMLVCAEDLGMVPDCVPWVMDELKILSLELQSMPKDPTVKFGHLSRNPYRSVCTITSMICQPCVCGGTRTSPVLRSITTRCSIVRDQLLIRSQVGWQEISSPVTWPLHPCSAY